MGRTSIATTSQCDAIFYNPANLAMIDDRMLQGSGRIRFGSADDEYWESDFTDDVEVTYGFHPKITHLSYAFPIYPENSYWKLAFGIGYSAYFDYGMTSKEERRHDDPLLGQGRLRTRTTKTHGGLNTLSPAVAVSIDAGAFFGMAFSKSILGRDSKDIDYEYSYEVPGYQLATERWEATGSANFITLGAGVEITSEMYVGAMYRMGFELEFDDVETYQERIDGEEWTDDLIDSEYEIPPYFGMGAIYEINRDILLAAEIQTRPYSDIEHDGRDNRGIDDGLCYRFGAELQNSLMAFRAGFFSDAIEATDDPYSEKDPKHLMGVTGGVGFESGDMVFDFFGEYSWWSWENERSVGGDDLKFDYRENLFEFGMTVTLVIL
jgi:hypothetical protein